MPAALTLPGPRTQPPNLNCKAAGTVTKTRCAIVEWYRSTRGTRHESNGEFQVTRLWTRVPLLTRRRFKLLRGRGSRRLILMMERARHRGWVDSNCDDSGPQWKRGCVTSEADEWLVVGWIGCLDGSGVVQMAPLAACALTARLATSASPASQWPVKSTSTVHAGSYY